MIVTDENGKQWKWSGYGLPTPGSTNHIALGRGFVLVPESVQFDGKMDIWCPYVPAPKQHTFGGVVFEEAGSARVLEAGEWFRLRGDGSPCCAVDRTIGEYIPLRPVRVEAE